MTQQEFADRVGTTRQWVIRLEHGQNSPAMSTVLVALSVLGLELVALHDLVREGRGSADGLHQFRTTTRPMGRAKVNLDKALRLAGELEDGELASRPEIGS